MLLNHFLAYRILSAGFFTQENRSFSESDNVLEMVTKVQPIFEKIPILGDLMGIPFQLMNTCRQVKTQTINANISNKISKSNFVTEAQITVSISYAIEQFINHKDFNKKIMIAIEQQEQSYLNSLFEKITQAKRYIQNKVFGMKGEKYSYVSEVVAIHMTLITKKIYECQTESFIDATTKKQSIFDFLLQSIYDVNVQKKIQNLEESKQRVHEKKQAAELERQEGSEKQEKSFWAQLCACLL